MNTIVPRLKQPRVHPGAWWVAALLVLWATASATAVAIDLQPQTSEAYDTFLDRVTRAFESRARSHRGTKSRQEGVLPGRPGSEDGIVEVPGGLVHHWVGTALVRGVKLAQVVAVSESYAAYTKMYKAVLSSRIITKGGDSYRVMMRLREGEAGITAVLDVESTIRYTYPVERVAYAISNAEQIREVKDAGRRDERLLPAGRDSGYLWRANTFTYFSEQDDGVYIEMETLGLSRRFPPMLGWLIEPIARRMGRKSVENSLQEFLTAIRASRGLDRTDVTSHRDAETQRRNEADVSDERDGNPLT